MSRIVRIAVAFGVVVAAAATTPAAQAQTVSGRIPAGAHRHTGALPTVGEHGAPFSPQTAKTPNVVGGGPVNSSSFPGVVGIQTFFPMFDPGTNQVQQFVVTCTGTVLSATEVLTAAHCNTNLPDATSFVIAGRSNLGDAGGAVAKVASTWTHPGFNIAALKNATPPPPVDDVQVLRLAEALPSMYTPVQLTASGDQTPYAAGTTATLVGYGITATGQQDDGILRSVTEPIVSDTTCAAAMPGYDSTRMTCAGVPGGGVGSCSGDSGGPLFVSGVEAGITDWGPQVCAAPGTYSVYERLSTYNTPITNAEHNPALEQQDWSGDGHPDILGRSSDGTLTDYNASGISSDGSGGFAPATQVGSGWNVFGQLFRVTNWDGDDTQTILAMTPDGRLFRYDSDGGGGFQGATGVLIGSGFNAFSQFIPARNWSGDGLPAFIGRTSAGVLDLFEGDGHGGFHTDHGTQIGSGFNIFTQLAEVGNWTGTGNQTLLGVTSSGVLDLYQSNEAGGWTSNHAVQIGTGWNVFTKLFSVGDWSGEQLVDLMGITGSGQLLLYPTDGHGTFLTSNGAQIGQGWNALTAVF